MGEVIKVRKRNEGEEYIQAFPKFQKWINECLCCHEKGYDPSMPEQIKPTGGLGAYFIKKYFKPLPINEKGLCQQCARFLSPKPKENVQKKK